LDTGSRNGIELTTFTSHLDVLDSPVGQHAGRKALMSGTAGGPPADSINVPHPAFPFRYLLLQASNPEIISHTKDEFLL
jgi:hypothetical protein